MTKEILLTQGQITLVDDNMYDELNKHKWYAYKHRNTYYARRRGGGEAIHMHRQILGLSKGDGKITDHRNRDGLDNRRDNLRVVSNAINCRNHGGHPHNTSGVNGVCWNKHTSKWMARIKVNSKQIYLGVHLCIEDAVEARRQGEVEYWGKIT